MQRALIIFAVAASGWAARAQPLPSIGAWDQLSGGPSRAGLAPAAAETLAAPRWTLAQTGGQPIRFTGPAGPASDGRRVFVTGLVGTAARAFAVDADTGSILWAAPIPSPVFDSWSSPAYAPPGAGQPPMLLVATGSRLTALHAHTGAQLWQAAFPAPIVNASPLVVAAGTPRARAFITDYGGFGSPSNLYCVNLASRRDNPTPINPFDPGQLIWAAPVGSAVGATPAEHAGVVYVASTGLDAFGAGEIRAFDAYANTQPAPRWTFTNTIPEGFFGGVAVRETAAGVFIYAASYAFGGGLDSANLVKVRAADGALAWSVASNRSQSTPIVLADGRVLLAAGIAGFGSAPSVQLFADLGSSAVLLWDTALDTWTDANFNGEMDAGEYLALGGWSTHPVLAERAFGAPSATRLLVGTLPTSGSFYGPYVSLAEIDLDRSPNQPGFVVRSTPAAGSTPAILGRGVYSVGTAGLAAFGPPPPRTDVNADGRTDIEDLIAWESQSPGSARDVDRSGAVTSDDRDLLEHELRRNHARDAANGRAP